MNTLQNASIDCARAAADLTTFFETLSPSTLVSIERHYARDARFKDPFNDVAGIAAIRPIFEHMFASLDQPRFAITGCLLQGQQCFMTWEFRFGFKTFRRGQTQLILGASHLVFSEQGLVTLHRDYWDAAEELYEKLPAVGSLMRWLKRQARR